MAGIPVQLYVYDLTRGMAAQFSPMLLGTHVEGVWHTGLVVGKTEFYFSAGIKRAPAGTTPFGVPTKVLPLGHTELPMEILEDYLEDIQPRFTPATYHLLHHNCNHFTHELASFLLGTGIPVDIVRQHERILNSPLGPLIRPMLEQLENVLGGVSSQN